MINKTYKPKVNKLIIWKSWLDDNKTIVYIVKIITSGFYY